jgi:phosphopantetheinyl transferase (holo-ACP synthase)
VKTKPNVNTYKARLIRTRERLSDTLKAYNRAVRFSPTEAAAKAPGMLEEARALVKEIEYLESAEGRVNP